MLSSMRAPIYVRPVMDAEREQLTAGLRSSDAFVLRRCQILLASARGERASQIARQLGCDDETVRRVIRAFNARGVAALRQGSSRPRRIHAAFDRARGEQLRALLHQSPRTFGQPTSVWTLELAAAVSCEDGLAPTDGWEEQAWLRFVAGRPVSARTTEFLAWGCTQLAAAGKEALLLVWDNASWHVSQAVRQWIREHNRGVKTRGPGVRIVNCYLPIKSPWLNPIEPKWVHGKRHVVEADRLLTAAELRERVCAAFDCPLEDLLGLPVPLDARHSIPAKVA